jgi:hypothetical protein
MGLIRLLFTNPFAFILLIIPLLYSIIIHELAHEGSIVLAGPCSCGIYNPARSQELLKELVPL